MVPSSTTVTPSRGRAGIWVIESSREHSRCASSAAPYGNQKRTEREREVSTYGVAGGARAAVMGSSCALRLVVTWSRTRRGDLAGALNSPEGGLAARREAFHAQDRGGIDSCARARRLRRGQHHDRRIQARESGRDGSGRRDRREAECRLQLEERQPGPGDGAVPTPDRIEILA